MEKAIEYVGYEQASNDFGLLSYYYPIVKIDGEYVTIHSIKSFDKNNNDNFNHVIEELGYAILEQFDENSNYGLAFHVCGYDGEAQTEFERYYMNEYGIEVF